MTDPLSGGSPSRAMTGSSAKDRYRSMPAWSRDVICPKCQADAGAPCRTLTTGRTTDTHTARAAAFYEARRQHRDY